MCMDMLLLCFQERCVIKGQMGLLQTEMLFGCFRLEVSKAVGQPSQGSWNFQTRLLKTVPLVIRS